MRTFFVEVDTNDADYIGKLVHVSDEKVEKWFADNGIPLYASNDNPSARWSTSRKVFAHLYIDDMAAGVPLKLNLSMSNRKFVDWKKIENWLEENGYL